MTLSQYVQLLRERWLILFSTVVLSLFLAVAFLTTAQKQYTSTTSVYVSIPTSTSSSIGENIQSVTLSTFLLQTYSRIATSSSTLAIIRDDLGLSGNAKLNGTLSASIEANTLLMRLTATSPDPVFAKRLATTAAAEMNSILGGLATGNEAKVSAKVIEPAVLPTVASTPRPKRTLSVALVLGLLGGVALASLRAALDGTIRTLGDAKAILGVPAMAVIPHTKRKGNKRLIAVDPHEPRAEPYRALRTSIRFADHTAGGLHTLLITSPQPSEGKSTVASNLSIALAQSGESVCLIDADFRRSSISGYFQVSGSRGLTSVMTNNATLEDVLVERHGVAVLPAGPKLANPSEYLGSQAFVDILDELSHSFDIVVIDAPPVLPVTDAVVLSTHVDAVLLVTRHGKTKRGDASKARDLLGVVSANTLGFVLNATKGRFSEYRYTNYDTARGAIEASDDVAVV